MRAGDRIGPERNLHVKFAGALEHVRYQRQGLLDVCETFFVVIPDAQKLRLIFQVV
jgi:hypothetical protein